MIQPGYAGRQRGEQAAVLRDAIKFRLKDAVMIECIHRIMAEMETDGV